MLREGRCALPCSKLQDLSYQVQPHSSGAPHSLGVPPARYASVTRCRHPNALLYFRSDPRPSKLLESGQWIASLKAGESLLRASFLASLMRPSITFSKDARNITSTKRT